MIQQTADSPSVAMRASHIFHIRIESSRPGDWTPSAQAGVQRRVELDVVCVEVMKGEVQEAPGTSLTVEITQHDTGTTRIHAVPGAWSGRSVDPGQSYVVFAKGADETAAALLVDPITVRPTEEAYRDVQLVQHAEAASLSPPGLLDLSEQEAGRLNDVFSNYLWERLYSTVLQDAGLFDRVLALIEQSDLSPAARSHLLDHLDAEIAAYDDLPDRTVNAYARGLFRLIGAEHAAALHDEIVGVMLPDLLRLEQDDPDRTADVVFDGAPAERNRARQNLRGYRGPASTEMLSAWLE